MAWAPAGFSSQAHKRTCLCFLFTHVWQMCTCTIAISYVAAVCGDVIC